MKIIRNVYPLLKRTVQEWMDDSAPTYAAALAYYTVFSIAPLLIIAVAIAGLVFGQEAAAGEIHQQIEGLVGTNGAVVIQDMMANASRPRSGIIASVLGVAVLVFGATGVFVELQDFLNRIWEAKAPPMSGVLGFLRARFLSFSMVLGVGFLLLVSLLVSAALAALGGYLSRVVPGWELFWQVINTAIAFAVVTLLFAMIYKILPDTDVQWRDVWLGAVVTSLLFSLGKLGIGYYLGKTSVASTYGAAGSLAIVLLWVYYSAQILFFGAEFTQVYAQHRYEAQGETSAKQNVLGAAPTSDRTGGESPRKEPIRVPIRE